MQKVRKVLPLLLAVMLLLSACASRKSSPAAESASETLESEPEAVTTVESSTMRLLRTEGTVSLTGEDLAPLPVQLNMRLFSGNTVSTETESRAGIGLDDFKAATIGEQSRATLHQNGRKLAMDLQEGTMYFSVSRPLDEDESFEISTSTMTMGIRGTSGFVSAVSGNQSVIILTSGHAEVTTADGKTVTAAPGRRVTISLSDDGTAEITDEPITPEDYPSLLLEELAADEPMLAEADGQNEGDLTAEVSAMNAYREIIRRADTYTYRDNGREDIGPTGTYRYALVRMSENSPVPALLLAQEWSDYMEFVRVFQYDPASGTVTMADETLMQGVAQMGGYRGGLEMMASGYGLRDGAVNGMTGDSSISRVTLEGTRLIRERVWTGMMGDPIPEEYSGADILWEDTARIDGLNAGV